MRESGGLECGNRRKRAWRQSGPGSDATPFVAARHHQSRPTPPITVCRTTILPRLHIVIFVSVFLLAFIPVSVEGLASSQRCVTRTPGRSRRMTTCLSHHVVVTQTRNQLRAPKQRGCVPLVALTAGGSACAYIVVQDAKSWERRAGSVELGRSVLLVAIAVASASEPAFQEHGVPSCLEWLWQQGSVARQQVLTCFRST
jgi:hypothetical protein